MSNAKILNESEAEAVYNAICSLNNVSGIATEINLQLVSVKTLSDRWIIVKDHQSGLVEEYDGQFAFASAYNFS